VIMNESPLSSSPTHTAVPSLSQIVSRGAPPLGGGEVLFESTPVKVPPSSEALKQRAPVVREYKTDRRIVR